MRSNLTLSGARDQEATAATANRASMLGFHTNYQTNYTQVGLICDTVPSDGL
jgi:hypothetical protein